MDEKLESIILKWLGCELTGDAAMSQIVNVLDEDTRREEEGNGDNGSK